MEGKLFEFLLLLLFWIDVGLPVLPHTLEVCLKGMAMEVWSGQNHAAASGTVCMDAQHCWADSACHESLSHVLTVVLVQVALSSLIHSQMLCRVVRML